MCTSVRPTAVSGHSSSSSSALVQCLRSLVSDLLSTALPVLVLPAHSIITQGCLRKYLISRLPACRPTASTLQLCRVTTVHFVQVCFQYNIPYIFKHSTSTYQYHLIVKAVVLHYYHCSTLHTGIVQLHNDKLRHARTCSRNRLLCSSLARCSCCDKIRAPGPDRARGKNEDVSACRKREQAARK